MTSDTLAHICTHNIYTYCVNTFYTIYTYIYYISLLIKISTCIFLPMKGKAMVQEVRGKEWCRWSNSSGIAIAIDQLDHSLSWKNACFGYGWETHTVCDQREMGETGYYKLSVCKPYQTGKNQTLTLKRKGTVRTRDFRGGVGVGWGGTGWDEWIRKMKRKWFRGPGNKKKGFTACLTICYLVFNPSPCSWMFLLLFTEESCFIDANYTNIYDILLYKQFLEMHLWIFSFLLRVHLCNLCKTALMHLNERKHMIDNVPLEATHMRKCWMNDRGVK